MVANHALAPAVRFTPELGRRVVAALSHVAVFDRSEPVYRDDQKWLALMLMGLAHRSPTAFDSMVIEDDIAGVRISVSVLIKGSLEAITIAERNALTAAALTGAWPYSR